MKALAALLLLAAAASASFSPWLLFLGAWAALIVLVMWGINAYRDHVEEGAGPDEVVGWIEKRGFVRMRRRS